MASQNRRISFSPPDVGEAEIAEMRDAVLSGWITTGPKTKELERQLKSFTGAAGVACLNSATAALECALRILGIGPGDEVITTSYTYTASASCICHVGATPVLVDTGSDADPHSYEMDYESLARFVTPRTKAIIPVDFAGRMCDYDRIERVLRSPAVCAHWQPSNPMQQLFDRLPIIADAAHSLGASYHGRTSGTVADFTCFSFHAVKNLTTAEGGAITWRNIPGLDGEELYRTIMLYSLHGQNKDALAKDKAGAWEYDILFPGHKCNMTDIAAAMGLAQLRRYPEMLERRRAILEMYQAQLADLNIEFLQHYGDDFASSGHLAITRLRGASMAFRNAFINELSERGIAANVHYKPLPMLTAYRNLGFSIDDFPRAHRLFEQEMTLPLHTLLTDEDVAYTCSAIHDVYRKLEQQGL